MGHYITEMQALQSKQDRLLRAGAYLSPIELDRLELLQIRYHRMLRLGRRFDKEQKKG